MKTDLLPITNVSGLTTVYDATPLGDNFDVVADLLDMSRQPGKSGGYSSKVKELSLLQFDRSMRERMFLHFQHFHTTPEMEATLFGLEGGAIRVDFDNVRPMRGGCWGYTPYIYFILNQEKRTLEATASLKGDPRKPCGLRVLEDALKLVYPKRRKGNYYGGTGKIDPRLMFDSETVHVTSPGHLFAVTDIMKAAYESIGERRFKVLFELRTPAAAGNEDAREKYDEALSWATPTNLRGD